MKRRTPAAIKKGAPPVCCDTGFAADHPALAAHLTDLWWDGGTAREPGSLTVRMSSEEVFLALSEPDEKASAYTTSETLAGALSLMEDALKSGAIRFKTWKRK